MLRLLPPGTRGKGRLAKRMIGTGLQSNDVRVISRDGFEYIVPSLQEPVGFHLLIDGVYEPSAVRLMVDYLERGHNVIDVGANIGVFTLPAAHKVGSEGRVVAIEPSPRVYPYLQRNVADSKLTNILLSQRAACNRDEDEIAFYEAPIEHFGMGSLGVQFTADAVSVKTCTIDTVVKAHDLGQIHFIKADVEGFEIKVFEGASEVLKGNPLIMFEFCDWAEARVLDRKVGAAQELLKDYGYQVWRLDDWINRQAPLKETLRVGFETLIASNVKAPLLIQGHHVSDH
jgi:FkbM family methyltransferase